MPEPCDKEERIQRLEGHSATLMERVDSLIKRMDRNTNVSTALIITIISGLVVTVLGGLILSLIVGLVTYFVVNQGGTI